MTMQLTLPRLAAAVAVALTIGCTTAGFGSGSGRKRYAAEVFRGYDTAGGKRLP